MKISNNPTLHDPRTCENSKPCQDCEHPCKHEDNITYNKLHQVDGEPQYNVTCEDCQAKGVIYLEETEEKWL